MYRHKCRICKSSRLWKVRRSKLKCSICHYEFVPRIGGLKLTYRQWKVLIKWFLRSQSINVVEEETKLSRYIVLKAVGTIHQAMKQDSAIELGGLVEVDETFVGGSWKNKRKSVRREQKTKRGRGTSKQPVFGILCRNGKVWIEVIPNTEAVSLQPLIQKRVKRGSVIISDKWRGYTGIASKGYVHRLIDHSKEEYSDKKGTHINGLEGFWGYLKRNLASRGGIRKERLPTYLNEYIWRFNNRNLTVENQVEKLLKLVANF